MLVSTLSSNVVLPQRGEIMKVETFTEMINNAPMDATHYRKFKNKVVFYRGIDSRFGSYQYLDWYSDEEYPPPYWTTLRKFPDLKLMIEL
jgi:hypothetical protein